MYLQSIYLSVKEVPICKVARYPVPVKFVKQVPIFVYLQSRYLCGRCQEGTYVSSIFLLSMLVPGKKVHVKCVPVKSAPAK